MDLFFLFCTQPLQPQIFRVSKFKLVEAMQPQLGFDHTKGEFPDMTTLSENLTNLSFGTYMSRKWQNDEK